jgi:acyl carrier protein
MTLIHELEERFQIELDLSDADPERLVTLGGLADIVVESLPMTR